VNKDKIIAAVRDDKAFLEALKSKVRIIFDLSPSIESLEEKVEKCQKYDKLFFIHIDLAEGIGKDKAGLKYVKKCGVDGIISTRVQLIKLANDVGLKTVQRTFIVDSQSIDTAISSFKTKPDMAEIMPGVLSAKVIERICESVDMPVIAGGLIETEEEVDAALLAGATMVSTGKAELWDK